MEREQSRTREAEAEQPNYYEAIYKLNADLQRRREQCKVVIKASDRPWQDSRQGRIKYYVHPIIDDTAIFEWGLFVHDVRTHSGRHVHQGGLAIYVLEGKGWTIVDGVRYDWEEGDLILLPLKPRGVEHQHFNAEPGKPCRWLALVYMQFYRALGSQMEQKEAAPGWSGQA